MKHLLIRADDLGYSCAVNVGLVRSAAEGLARSVGVMPNMPETERGLAWLRDSGADVALGQHSNVCLGVPVADASLVPSLLGPDGNFRSSREYRARYQRGEDFVAFDEAVVELEAQLARFRELTGRDPDYFEAHAVLSPNLNRAVSHVARTHGLLEQPVSFDPAATVDCGGTPVRMVMRSMSPDYDPAAAIRQTVESMADGETVVFVCHPGYLDDFILHSSSLTTDRTKEVDALVDPALRAWLESRDDLRLIDYRDLA
ncbi:ChbG/HpnK family deacetylase [Olsenella sp. DNF00959]|uniref:ChbG/HpnK family deacetylase n=1 Tax=Olsenella sp. DNF00959 TaxID=1476999 RepID=UPI000782A449|nr:ChbG/HpnK family deacetylase [Olsenella sp. DNF00959]KXB61890.1 YdjC-like protein [Olsenella sp. DNF00959]